MVRPMTRLALPLLVLAACQDYDLKHADEDPGHSLDDDTSGPTTDDGQTCGTMAADPEAVAPTDACHFEVSSFNPVVAWQVESQGLALPAVGDLDGDGIPEIVAVFNVGLLGPGMLAVYHGDGSGEVWEDAARNYAYGSGPTIADVDGDGSPEIYAVEMISDNLFGAGEYKLVALDADGNDLWETSSYTGGEFDHATGIIVSDMDHDGSAEIIAGNVIFNADGSQRAEGEYHDSRGAPTGFGSIREGTFPAVADLDLDGQEELITGNTIYDIDGQRVWRNTAYSDGSVSVANLDGDPEGEFVVVYGNTYRAHDTNGDLLWGDITIRSGNILSSPAIGDLDGDGQVEIIVAGGNELDVVHADGTPAWTAPVHDESGATGASIFDFDGDGVPEVVYIDERQMVAFNGADGVIKFQSTQHSSVTMYDYPVIADVDANGHADIVVMDQGDAGMEVFRDAADSWAPVRAVWNQHAYSITNINDDLTVPATAVPNWTVYNSYHSANALPPGEALGANIGGEILEVCQDDCDTGQLRVLARVDNSGSSEIPAGVSVSLYAVVGGDAQLLATETTPAAVPAEMSSEGIEFVVDADAVVEASALYLVVDDDGTGTGAISECLEDDNGFQLDGAYCR